jgi:DNA-binding MarR family transcriptional regulator
VSVQLQRKVRRILAALDLANRPLTMADLIRATCHTPGTVAFTLHRLERAGWITRSHAPNARAVYQLTDHGRQNAGIQRQENP